MIDPQYKLVRDNIPEFIFNDCSKAEFRFARDDEEYLEYVVAKLDEEVEELKQAIASGNIQDVEGELADVYEVLSTVSQIKKTAHIVELARMKRCERGGFSNQCLLKVDKTQDRL